MPLRKLPHTMDESRRQAFAIFDMLETAATRMYAYDAAVWKGVLELVVEAKSLSHFDSVRMLTEMEAFVIACRDGNNNNEVVDWRQ